MSETNKGSEIVVTGLAAISTAGVGLEPLAQALEDGICRLSPVPEAGWEGALWGRIEGFRGADFMSPLKARKFDRCSLFAVVGAGMALKDAGIEPGELDLTRVGIVLGCGFGGISYAEEFLRGYFSVGIEGLVPMLFPNIVPNAAASNASIEHQLKGPNVTTIQRFCSAESALLMARRFLEEDRADVVIAGGVDEISLVILQGFKALGQLRSHGSGFAEGTGLLVLEKAEHSRKRQARVRARMGQVRSIGRLAETAVSQGLDRLLPDSGKAELVSLSGCASRHRRLLDRLPAAAGRLEIGPVLGRSLGMGGLAMVSLVLQLKDGQQGLHLAASPEGPWYAIDWLGGGDV